MIKTKEGNSNCCGCEACVQICPKQCISFEKDSEGFGYPHVKIDDCINCNLCESVCPFLSNPKERIPLQVFNSKATDETIRYFSSSGGVFSILAKQIIEKGGLVYGAQFDDDWNVKHTFSNTGEGIKKYRGSKYVQSRIADSFLNVKKKLNDGKLVLFSGTPCQVFALKLFLRKRYDNLITVDFVCHGVPSPKVWSSYLQFVKQRKKADRISSINFRDKIKGWKQFSLSIGLTKGNGEEFIFSEDLHENIYMQLFLNNISIRPSCFNCPVKCGKSGSDLTIADFWGIEHIAPETFDDKGNSLIMIYNPNILSYINIGLFNQKRSYEEACRNNSSIIKPVTMHPKRALFFSLFTHEKDFNKLNKKLNKKSVNEFITHKKNILKSIIYNIVYNK